MQERYEDIDASGGRQQDQTDDDLDLQDDATRRPDKRRQESTLSTHSAPRRPRRREIFCRWLCRRSFVDHR